MFKGFSRTKKEVAEINFGKFSKKEEMQVATEDKNKKIISKSYRDIKDSVKINRTEIRHIQQEYPKEMDSIAKKLERHSEYQRQINSNFKQLEDQVNGIKKNLNVIKGDISSIKYDSQVRQISQQRNDRSKGKLKTIQVQPRYILGSETSVVNVDKKKKKESRNDRVIRDRRVVNGNVNGRYGTNGYRTYHPYDKTRREQDIRDQYRSKEIRVSQARNKSPKVYISHVQETKTVQNDNLNNTLYPYGVRLDVLTKFFKENHIQDVNTKNQLILKAEKFIKKYSQIKSESLKSQRNLANQGRGFHPREEPVSIEIIEFALKNALQDHNYRNWMKSAKPEEIKRDVESKNESLKEHLRSVDYETNFGRTHPQFRNAELLYLLELKQLFLNDFQYSHFLQTKYPEELKKYGYHLFPSFKQSGYPPIQQEHAVSYPRRIRNITAKRSSAKIPKYTSVTVRSEYLNPGQRNPKQDSREVERFRETSLNRSAVGNRSQVIIRRNNYSLEPKVIRRSVALPKNVESVKNIIERNVSKGVSRVLSVNRIRLPVQKSVGLAQSTIVRSDSGYSGFGNWKIK
jgi:hypothetical protein